MKTKLILSSIFCCLVISGCGPSSDDKKSGGTPDQPVDAENLTDTRVCDDETKILNMASTFEATFGAKGTPSRITERFRLEETEPGRGIMTFEISCVTSVGANPTKAKAKVNYRRTNNSIETLEDIETAAVHDKSDENGCSVNLKLPKSTFTVTPKNSCLILNHAESNTKSVLFVPTQNEI